MASKGSKEAAEKREAVAEAASEAVEPLIAAEDFPSKPQGKRGRGADPLVQELRRHELLPLLVLRFLDRSESYGNQLMERVSLLTEGVLSVNPNTMYPLLRDLESRGLIEGHWEHPERRSRRFYRITTAGQAELDKMIEVAEPALNAVASTVYRVKQELYGEASVIGPMFTPPKRRS